MNKQLDKYQLIEYEFSTSLVKYLKIFNLLDKNIGLCISFLVNYSDPKATYPLLDRLTTQAKMDVLKELIFYKNSEANAEVIKDFNNWFKVASDIKAARNRYVHGHWHCYPFSEINPIHFYPTLWTSGVGKKKEKDNYEKMSMD